MTINTEQAYAFGEQQLKTPTPENGIVVIYSSACPHCHRSLENTNMATQTSNGTPVKWIDINNPEGMAAFQALNGVKQENGEFIINGRSITAVPTTVSMQNGVAAEVLKTGVLERSDLDMMAAMQKGKDAAHSTGKVYTYKTGPEAVGLSR